MEFPNANNTEATKVSNERREAERFGCPLELTFVVCNARGEEEGAPCVAQMKNISPTGVLVKTNRPVEQFQHVKLDIATKGCPEELNLPENFMGDGKVVTVAVDDDGACLIRLRFGETFLHNAAFAAFIDFLHVRFGLLKPSSDTD